MKRAPPGSIFRSSLLLAISSAFILAVASVAAVLTTPAPFDLPVSTLDVARALTGRPVVQKGAPLVFENGKPQEQQSGNQDAVSQAIATAIARQADMRSSAIQFSFQPDSYWMKAPPLYAARRKYELQLLETFELYRGDARFSPLIFGSFKASAQMPDGNWMTVSRTSDEPKWQYKAAVGILLVFLLIIPVAWLFSRRLSVPFREFGDAASRIGQGQFEEVAVSGPTEVRQAAFALNEMQARLKRYVTERTSMLAAIAHDLRTPLSHLKFLLNDMDDGVTSGDW